MDKTPLVVKSNSVVEASYRLTLNEQRLILMCISQIKKNQKICPATVFTVDAVTFSKTFDIPLKIAYRELITVADRLYDRSVTIHEPNPDDPSITHLKTRWVSAVLYKGDGEIMLGFSAQMIPYISMLEGRFTRYSIDAVSDMKSTYGMRFYELMKKWQTETGKTKSTKEIELWFLKKLLDLENKYKAIKDFKKYVLDPAMKDINNCTELTASYEQRKTGRRVSHIIFKFKTNNGIEKHQPRKQHYTRADLDKNPTLARPGEKYEEALRRLNNPRLGTEEEQTTFKNL